MKTPVLSVLLIPALLLFSCKPKAPVSGDVAEAEAVPVLITQPTPNDTDDPAIWYNKADPAASLILGTDKGDSTGGIFVFDLEGKLDESRSIRNLKRPNNIDVEYGFRYGDTLIDIAVFTERGRDMIRVISVPDCRFIDNGGIPVFADDQRRSPMGIGLYKDPQGEVYAFVSRKQGPLDGFLYQYRLYTDSLNHVQGDKVRALGKFSGVKEIEAIVVDDALGRVYYSDETVGVREYYADAARGNQELSMFARTGLAGDHEGLSIDAKPDGTGFIVLSDQQADKFRIYSRQGTTDNPNEHRLLRIVKAQTHESDGSDLIDLPLNGNFPHGIFVAMSTDRTFQYYRLEDIIGN